MPQYVRFPLPDVGEGLTEADIVAWQVAAGDVVAVNQNIVEIETAKSLVELPSPHAGVVTELLAEVGQTVEVGKPLLVIDTDPDGQPTDGGSWPGVTAHDGATPAAPKGADGGAPLGSTTEDGATPAGVKGDDDGPHRAAVAGDGGAHPGGDGATQAAAAQPAPATPAEEPAEASGDVLVGYGTKGMRTRRRRRAPEAAPPAAPATGLQPDRPSPGPSSRGVATTAPLVSASVVSASGRAPSSGITDQGAPPAAGPVAPSSPSGGVLAKPPVRKLARDLGLDLASVPGTGPGGIITRADVLAAQSQPEPARPGFEIDPQVEGGTVSADGRQTRVPVRSVRRRTAEAMVASAFTAPHVTVFSTVDVSKTMKLVKRLKADAEFGDVRVTPLLIAAKALILAIRRNPTISAAWDEAAQEIVYQHYINLGIAAATPRGLVVPNIKDAHRMSLHELAGALGELTATARAGKTTPAAMSDGTVTITNVGVFGIDTGTPILNPGESAILAFGAISRRPWVHKGKLKPRWVTQLALSFDHRLVDGELGSRVLADVARVMEDPTQGLVWG